jgi:hypothetical protein
MGGPPAPVLTPPEVAGHVWDCFVADLHWTREKGRPIRWETIESWARLNRRALERWELAALKAFDEGYLQDFVARNERGNR